MASTILPCVYLVRHGETEWTITGQHTGRGDIHLTPHGEDEARTFAVPLRRVHFSDVFTSPFEGRRLYLTGAVSILGYHHTVQQPVIRSWNEVSRGRLDGTH